MLLEDYTIFLLKYWYLIVKYIVKQVDILFSHPNPDLIFFLIFKLIRSPITTGCA